MTSLSSDILAFFILLRYFFGSLPPALASLVVAIFGLFVMFGIFRMLLR